MKKLLVMLLVVAGAFFLLRNKPVNDYQPILSISPTPVMEKYVNEFRYDFFTVNSNQEVVLIDNWTKKKTTDEIKSEYNCRQIINGGFYGKDDKPLGMFVNGEVKRFNPSPSSLVNGFLWGDSQTIHITNTAPENPVWGLQSGPLLLWEGKEVTLNLTNDENARRTFAVISQSGAHFGVVYSENSPLNGPTLQSLPNLVIQIAEKENWQAIYSINLDGGTASSFFNGKLFLKELLNTGSHICVK